MTTTEIINLVGIIVGPIVAVLITLFVDGRRRDREQKLVVLRLLLATRHLPADPNYSTAINLIPVEFSKSRPVMTAYKEFIEAASTPSTPETQASVWANIGTKNTRLIFEIARFLGFPLRETDLQTQAYSSSGWGERDRLFLDSQRAGRDLVNVLLLHARIAAGAPLNEHELALLNLRAESQ